MQFRYRLAQFSLSGMHDNILFSPPSLLPSPSRSLPPAFGIVPRPFFFFSFSSPFSFHPSRPPFPYYPALVDLVSEASGNYDPEDPRYLVHVSLFPGPILLVLSCPSASTEGSLEAALFFWDVIYRPDSLLHP